MTAEALYRMRCAEGHNIDQHLPTIREYASRCQHVTELGVERGWSTSALLASGAHTVRSYDLVRWPEVDLLEQVAREAMIDFRFILDDSRTVQIEPTDLLFVDTDHTYDQVDKELARHIDCVSRFLIFHDIVTFAEIVPAIVKHCFKGWRCVHWAKHQNGLGIFERVSD